MNSFELCNRNGSHAKIMVDAVCPSGVKKVADKVTADFNKVFGLDEKCSEIGISSEVSCDNAIIITEDLEGSMFRMLKQSGKLNTKLSESMRECYGKFYIENPTPSIKNALVIAGSDKLGTIYGAFDFSEMIGVSPLVYWGDAYVSALKEMTIDNPEDYLSKEPSVCYRGFFINDEWPCYGNWTNEHFGGFTAEMYDHVFELLLRLKGNYLWPAMWSSSFAWDGPGLKSFELADEYGIYMGNSHHEPCYRAGEEYRQVRGKDSIYGDAWNFMSNTEGITRFWKDSLDERAHLNGVCTVGMRGEADSTILGANATLKDNIDLLKNVITCQKKLLKETEARVGHEIPKMLALYKEVEPFYYGDADTEGLCEWKELEDIILMLCEDNHGFMRSLPDDKMRKHPAGFGMYYHFDYHGDPISYEWVNSTPLSKTWEQMTEAYEFGVRKLWIVNVGDLKHNEYPLSYFMDLAYDYEKWGISNPESYNEYPDKMLKAHFGNALSDEEISKIRKVHDEYIRLNGYRRPEALNPYVYSPCHYDEADRMLERVDKLETMASEVEAFIKAKENAALYDAWYSLSGFQTYATANLIKMHLYGGKNMLYARQGRASANMMADKVAKAISKDRELAKQFKEFKDGKWSGMELEAHIGFTKWNEDGCKYPLKIYVEPYNKPRMQVMRSDSERVYDKVYGAPMEIVCDDFMYADARDVKLIIANNGCGTVNYSIVSPDCEWVKADKLSGTAEFDDVVTFKLIKDKLPQKAETVKFKITDNETNVIVSFSGIKQDEGLIKSLPDKTFLPSKFGYMIEAKDYADKFEPEGTKLLTLDDYGIRDSAVKAFPSKYRDRECAPLLTYRLYCDKPGKYMLTTWFAPVSPHYRDNKLAYGVSVNGSEAEYKNTVDFGYRSGVCADREWAEGVTNHRRETFNEIELKEGVNEITLSLPDAGTVPFSLLITPVGKPADSSYMGPFESFMK